MTLCHPLYLIALSLLLTLSIALPAKAQDCTSPAGPSGKMFYSPDYDVLQVCTPKGWMGLNPPACPLGDGCNPVPPDPCDGTQAIGTTCADGTIYAGLSPDGNVPMFTTPADAPTLMSWNNGTLIFEYTGMQNCTSASPGAQASCRTGRANTDLLVGLGSSPTPAPYVAANYCYDLDAHGHTDWYLPAQDELNVLYVNLARDGAGDVTPGNSFGFNRTGSHPAGRYWSSSEYSSGDARYQIFSVGSQTNNFKPAAYPVRCVRSDP